MEKSWFKVSADIVTNKKIRIIRDEPNGDSIALLWFLLLALAREQNDGGYIYVTEGVAYTPKTLAAVCGFKKAKVVEQGLELLQEYNMIGIEDNGYIYIIKWENYQNTEALAKISNAELSEKERTRLRVAKYRENQKKKCNGNGVTNSDNVTLDVTDCNGNCNSGNARCNDSNVTNSDNVTLDVTDIKNKSKNKIEKKNNNSSCNARCNGNSVTNSLTCNANPVTFWNQNVTPITPYIAERLQAIVTEHGEATALQAVTITAEQGKKSIAYCEGVARNIASGSKPKKPPDNFKPPDDQTDLDDLF